MGFYLAINKHSSLIATWMELEVNIVSEISKTQKDKYHIFLPVETGSSTLEKNELEQ